MSSAAVVIGALRVNEQYLLFIQECGEFGKKSVFHLCYTELLYHFPS